MTLPSKPCRATRADGTPIEVPCKTLVREGRWTVEPKDRPEGWSTDPRFANVREEEKQ